MANEVLAAFLPIAVYWIGAGIYHVMLSSMEKQRLFTEEEERAQNLVSRRRVLVGVLLNQALQMTLLILATKATEGRMTAAASKPTFLRLAWQFLVAMLVLDIWQYMWHRFVHENKFMYRHVHAVHHQLVVPYSYGAQYIHPIDSLLGDSLAGALATLASGMSPWTTAVFVSIVTIKGLDDHSGLWFPSNPISRLMSNNSAFHALHHQHQGVKHNYSTFFFVTWDLLFNTYLPFSIEERKGGGYWIRTAKDQ